MKSVLAVVGLSGSIIASGCAEQMVQHDVSSHCAAQGKRAFVVESEHQGVPLFIESANAMYYCVAPEDIIAGTVAGERVPIKLRRNQHEITATAQF